MIIVINLVRACVRMSAEDDDSQRLSKGRWGGGRGGGGICVSNDFI